MQFIGSTLTILALVNTGLGVARVPQNAANLRFDGVIFRSIELGPGIQSELHLVWRDDNDNPAVAMMLDTLRQAGEPCAAGQE